MHTYRVTTNEQDLYINAVETCEHVGFDSDGNEIVEVTSASDIAAQLTASPAVITYEEV